jgi:hypothetical protein
VEAAKSSGGHEGHDQKSDTEDKHMESFAEIEVANAAGEQVGHEEVE